VAIERVTSYSDAQRGTAATVAEAPLAEVVRRLVDALQPETVYLFGARARGDNQPDSDYDLMIVVRASELPPHRRAQLAHRAVSGIRVAADLLVWTREEFDRFLPVPGSLAATVLREGRLLYDARSPV
jgi:predicted nucleotidyltransferase